MIGDFEPGDILNACSGCGCSMQLYNELQKSVSMVFYDVPLNVLLLLGG